MAPLSFPQFLQLPRAFSPQLTHPRHRPAPPPAAPLSSPHAPHAYPAQCHSTPSSPAPRSASAAPRATPPPLQPMGAPAGSPPANRMGRSRAPLPSCPRRGRAASAAAGKWDRAAGRCAGALLPAPLPAPPPRRVTSSATRAVLGGSSSRSGPSRWGRGGTVEGSGEGDEGGGICRTGRLWRLTPGAGPRDIVCGAGRMRFRPRPFRLSSEGEKSVDKAARRWWFHPEAAR